MINFRAMKKKPVMKFVKSFIFLAVFLSWQNAFAVYGFGEAETARFNKDKAAAENGDPEAQMMLSRYYLDQSPNVIPQQDVTEGMRWLTKAAESGYVPAQNELAGHYNSGVKDRNYQDVIKRDLNSVEIWTLKAAKQGDLYAIKFMISIVKWKSPNVTDPSVTKEEYVWASLAANNGDSSTVLVKLYGDQLSPELKQSAQLEIDKIQEEINANKSAKLEKTSDSNPPAPSQAINFDPQSMVLKDFNGNWKVVKLLSNSGSQFTVLSQASGDSYMVYEFSDGRLTKYDVKGNQKAMISIETGIKVEKGIMRLPISPFAVDSRKISIEEGLIVLKGTFDTVLLQKM